MPQNQATISLGIFIILSECPGMKTQFITVQLWEIMFLRLFCNRSGTSWVIGAELTYVCVCEMFIYIHDDRDN